MNLAWALGWSLTRRATRVLMVDDRRSYRGVDLLVAGMHCADAVRTRSSTERVGIMLPTSGVFGAALFGVLSAGRTAVPLNYLLERGTLEFTIEDCGCDVVLASRALVEFMGYEPRGATMVYLEDLPFRSVPAPAWPAMGPAEAPAVVLYTSGTSGTPKGVVLSHRNLMSNVHQVERHVGLEKGDVFMGVLPQFHSFGITALTLAPMLLGCRVVYTARFVPTKVLELIKTHGATIYIGIPSMFSALLGLKRAGPEDLASLRLPISGGEPLHEDTRRRFEAHFGIGIFEGYGMTETSPVTHVLLPSERRPGTVGRPVPGVVQRIVDPESGCDVEPGTDGELRLKGPNIMMGYLHRPQETRDAFDERGFLRTGDMARADADGFVTITGRIKEMLIVGGENVFPREIEEVLNAHECVHASGVVGTRCPVRGEVPCAFVEPEEGDAPDADTLRVWCRERLAGYKVPRRIEIVDELPRSPTGKVLRRALAERLAREASA